METVLYEQSDIFREDLSHVYGKGPLVEAFLRFHEENKARGKSLTTYSAKRVVQTQMKDVVVYGIDPILRPMTAQEKTRMRARTPFAAVLVQKWGFGYYHFLNEMLPKILRIYERYPTLPLLLYTNDTFIPQILAYIGVTNPILSYTKARIHTIKDAIHVTETVCGNPSPNDIDLIRRHLRLRHEARDLNLLIYRKESVRSLVNFEEVRRGLEAEITDAPWVVFSSLPFAEAVALFQRAKRIVGAHGAGLSNMILAPRNTPVIELVPADSFNACYWHLSWILSNPHSMLVCETSSPMQALTVDVGELVSLVRAPRNNGAPPPSSEELSFSAVL